MNNKSENKVNPEFENDDIVKLNGFDFDRTRLQRCQKIVRHEQKII